MFAKFCEILSLPFQDIEKPKHQGRTLRISIHVIFSWVQIGRSAIFGSQIGRFFRGKKYSILVSKIVICNTVDHCKIFYLPAYG